MNQPQTERVFSLCFSFAMSQCVIPEEYWQVNENGGKYIEVDLGDDSFTQIGESQIELDRLEEYLK